jgi:hypothetical protein
MTRAVFIAKVITPALLGPRFPDSDSRRGTLGSRFRIPPGRIAPNPRFPPRRPVCSWAAVGTSAVSDDRGFRVDFGDGEVVLVKIREQSDLNDILRNVNAAGLRRRAANGFPVNNSFLYRIAEELVEDHEYMVWPRLGPEANPRGKS